ncbi:MAG: acyl-CoA dehydrogenase family protein [Pseudomonadales bacterium]|nr:acyl-CoA dehydrogenase family protein [Pseudomonadales bacterium]MDP5058788.1 acyl-CoA dehydrogenase family protein [Pseudomonadales bacterium]
MGLESFREEVRSWLQTHCPAAARGPGEAIPIGSIRPIDAELLAWRHALGNKGWSVPTWPRAYGGGGLSRAENQVLQDELRAIDARMPMPGMGTSMIGPTLLEYGTEEQKLRHMPGIVLGDVAWCQGYSEPGAGSDLASLRTQAVDKGDVFEINGQKIWTSGAQFADWMFALVRTDPNVPKHEGISFVLLDMHQPGVAIKPIRLIAGSSPFCETFFDNAQARKDDLIGQLNRGWAVGKRLLQHERSGQGGLGEGGGRPLGPATTLADVAQRYVGVDASGRIADPEARERVTRFAMNTRSFKLTQQRAREENTSGKTMGEAISIFKLYGATLTRDGADFRTQLMGSQGHGWEGEGFATEELDATRAYLQTRAVTIYGGTNEVQRNIIAKRVLGLPD